MANGYAGKVSLVGRYVQEISRYPLLSRDEEQAIAIRIRAGAEEDRPCHELVRSNLTFVVKIAQRYRNLGLGLEDLINEGNLGLLEAARRFDPARGTKFITCAVWWIRKSILQAVRRHALVRLPAGQMKRVRSVRDAGRTLSGRLGREAGLEEIAQALRLPTAKIDQILKLRLREVSLEEPAGRDGTSQRIDRLPDARALDPENEMIRGESRHLVRRALRQLDERERRVIVDRFGLEGGEAMTLRQVGQRLGVSREAVRLVEERAMKRLRRAVHPGPRGAAIGSPGRHAWRPAAGHPRPSRFRHAPVTVRSRLRPTPRLK